MELLIELLGDRGLAISAGVVIQCTLAIVLAMVVAGIRRNDAAFRVRALQFGLVCAIASPCVTIGLFFVGVDGVPIAVPTSQRSDTKIDPRPQVKESVAIANDTESLSRLNPHDSDDLRFLDSPDTQSSFEDVRTSPGTTSQPFELDSVPLTSSNPEPSSASGLSPRPPDKDADSTSFKSVCLRKGGIVWLGGIGVCLIGVGRSWWKMRRVVRRSSLCREPAILESAKRVQNLLLLDRPLQVRRSSDVRGPLAAGLIKPAILIPDRMDARLGRDEIDMVLMHEAAHLLRRDQFALLADRLFVALFWFHPAAYLLIGLLQRAREEVCDNYVLTRIDASQFSDLLLRLTRLLAGRAPAVLGAGFFGSHVRLEKRVKGLLNERRRIVVKTNSALSWTIAATMLAGLVVLGTTRIAAQAEPESRPRQDDTTRTTGDTNSVIATVDDHAITTEDLASYLLSSGDTEPIEALVNRRILELACAREGVVITNQQIDREVEKNSREFGLMSDEMYALLLAERHLTKERYRSDLIWPILAIQALAGDEDPAEYFQRLQQNANVVIHQSEVDSASLTERSTNLTQPVSNQPDEAATRSEIAVVDLAAVLESSPAFQSQMDALKGQIHQGDAAFRRLQQEIVTLQRALDAIGSSNAEAKNALQSLVDAKRSEIETQSATYRNAVIAKEAEIYSRIYARIQNEIRQYAEENGFVLVLRRHNQPELGTLPRDRNEGMTSSQVIERLTQPIVYSASSDDMAVDITEEIIERMRNHAIDEEQSIQGSPEQPTQLRDR